jgi:hypothetical protein
MHELLMCSLTEIICFTALLTTGAWRMMTGVATQSLYVWPKRKRATGARGLPGPLRSDARTVS